MSSPRIDEFEDINPVNAAAVPIPVAPKQAYQIETYDKRKLYSPRKLAVLHIRRFFVDSKRYELRNVVKSVDLDSTKTQTISDGIVFYTFFDKQSKGYVHVFYPCSDDNKPYEDTIPLKHALQIYKQSLIKYHDNSAHKLTIPIATKQARRKHWLELFIETNNKANASQACLTDSRSETIGKGYQKNYMQEAVSELHGENQLTTAYTGKQSILNKKDCGMHFLKNSECSLEKRSKQSIEITNLTHSVYEIEYEKYIAAISRKPSEVSNDGKIKRLIPSNTNHEFENSKNVEVQVITLDKKNNDNKSEVTFTNDSFNVEKKTNETFPKSYSKIWDNVKNKFVINREYEYEYEYEYEAALALLADYSKTTHSSGKFISSLKLRFTFHWNRHHINTVHDFVKARMGSSIFLEDTSIENLLTKLKAALPVKNLDKNSSLAKRIRFIQERTHTFVFGPDFFTEQKPKEVNRQEPKEVNLLEASFLKYRRNLN